MSKLLWILGAGAGVAALASMMQNEEDEDSPSTGYTPSTGDTPPEEPEGGDTPEPPKGGRIPQTPSGGDVPPTPSPTPTGDLPVEPRPSHPFDPVPYESYPRGPYTIDLTGLSTGVRWRVYLTAANPPTEAAKNTVAVGSNVELSDEDARVAAEAFVDALMVEPEEPELPLPPMPTPDGADGGAVPAPTVPPFPAPPRPGALVATRPGGLAASTPVVQKHGLNVSEDCTRIEVDSVVTWIAWAEPWVRDRVAWMPRQKLVEGLLAVSFPGCSWDLARVKLSDGRPLVDTLAAVDVEYFAKARAGVAWPEQEAWEPLPLERAVAELVGAVAPPVAPPEFAFLGYHVEIVEKGEDWGWYGWRRGKHGGSAELVGESVGTPEAAVIDARLAISALPG